MLSPSSIPTEKNESLNLLINESYFVNDGKVNANYYVEGGDALIQELKNQGYCEEAQFDNNEKNKLDVSVLALVQAMIEYRVVVANNGKIHLFSMPTA